MTKLKKRPEFLHKGSDKCQKYRKVKMGFDGGSDHCAMVHLFGTLEYSGDHKSRHGHYIVHTYVVSYFSIFPHSKSTARKALKSLWLNSEDSEIFRNGLLCSSSTSRPCAISSQSCDLFAFFNKKKRKTSNFC